MLPPGDHLISDFVQLSDGATFEATAFSTVAGGSQYTYLDTATFDLNYNQIGNLGWDEQYAAGTKVVAPSYGSWAAAQEAVYIDSVEIVRYPDGSEESTYTIGRVQKPRGGVEEPWDKNSDNIITVCHNRSFNDCDHPVVGQTVVKSPSRGT